MGTEERETLTGTLESAVEAHEKGFRVCVPKVGTEERETLTETLEVAVQGQEYGDTVSVPKVGTEERETLTETLESAVEAQGIGARVSVDGIEGVKANVYVEPRVVEVCAESAFVSTNDGDGRFVDDAKVTGDAAGGGLTDGDLTLWNRDGSYGEMGYQNGVAVGVEVNGLLDSVNKNGENCGYVDSEGSMAENEEIQGEEVVEIPGWEGKGKFEASHNGEENNGEGEEDAGDDGHEYVVGDFVWGKIRSHPWWPGRIYNPADASEYARKYGQGGKLLIAYFGDESFSWCSPTQLKPFAQDFEEMLGQSNSKSFVNAVQSAIDEMGKLVVFKMTCYCISDKVQVGFGSLAKNAGLKEGVLVPDCDVNKLLFFLNVQSELLLTLRSIAKGVSNISLPGLTVLMNWLSAFYRAKGGHKLPLFYEPVPVEGLEDKSRCVGVTDGKDFSGVAQVPFGGPVEEVWISSPMHPGLGQDDQLLLQKCSGLTEDKLYERRKKKTVAELIEEDTVLKPVDEIGSLVEDVTKPGELVKTSGKEIGKRSDEVVSRVGVDLSSPSGKKRGRGKKSGTEGSVKSQENKVRKKDGVSSIGTEDRKKAVTEGSEKSVEREVERAENGDVGGGNASSVGKDDSIPKEEAEKGLASRERKKSKYLSPPFTSLKRGVRNSGTEDSFDAKSVKIAKIPRIGERMIGVTDQLIVSTPVLNCSDETKVGNDAEIPESKSPRKRNRKKDQALAGVKKLEKDGVELRKKRKKETVDNEEEGEAASMPVTLIVTFPPGVSLPSKDDLKAVFRKFGTLNEKETDVLYNCSCGIVVFMDSSDTEKAFNASIKENPFGPAEVSYQLRYSVGGHEKAFSPSKEGAVDDASQVLFTVKEKLELMTSMLEKSDGNMMKGLLEVEMKGLLEVVNIVI